MNNTIVLFVFSLSCSASCFSADVGVATGVPSANTALIQTLLGLGVVIGLILVLAWFLKRLNLVGMSHNQKIKIVTAVPLGTREKAVLIDIQGKQLLLGVAPGRVSTLHVFDAHDGDETDDIETHKVEEVVEKSQQKLQLMKSSLAARSASEFSKKLNTFLSSGNK